MNPQHVNTQLEDIMNTELCSACHREAGRYLALAERARTQASEAAQEGRYGEAMALRDLEAKHRALRWDALQAASAT